MTDDSKSSVRLLERIRAAEDLASSTKSEEALYLANLLVDEHSSDARCWTCRSRVHAALGIVDAASVDALKAIDCDPSDRTLYTWACLLMTKRGAYLDCLEYVRRGLAAVGGWKSARAMHGENLALIGARALFELERYGEALDFLKSVSPKFAIGSRDDALMTRETLVKACKNALAKKPVPGK